MRIVTDEKVLRTKSELTSAAFCKANNVFGQLLDAVSSKSAAGLAAIQIGLPLRACIVRTQRAGSPSGVSEWLFMINPVITKADDFQRMSGEGCLSLPSRIVDTMRYQNVVATWTDPDGGIKNAAFYGIEAVAVQHEIDHMAGVLMIDKSVPSIKKPSRNAPCPCGSGEKYKKCCGKNEIPT